MNEDLLMELSDCGSPEGLAQIIHRYIPLKENGSTDLPAVAKAVGIKEIKPTDTPAYEGLLITDTVKSKGVILYNQNSPAPRKRFTVAHELGHFLLPFHDKNAQCASSDLKAIKSNSPNQTKEVEANRFAIELLAPKEQVRTLLKPHKTPDITQILDLHKRFKISKEAAARRFIECSDHSVAIIFGKAQSVRYTLKVEEFPYLSFKKGELCPDHIYEQVKDMEVDHITEWYCVDPHYFLSNPDDAEDMDLFCQTAMQKNGFHISLLSFDE